MYTEYFGLTEEPFSIAANPRFLYMSARHREALAHLLYGIRSDSGFVLLTGEVGTGKTTVCRCLLEQLPANTEVAFILNPRVTVIELLSSVCDELGIGYAPGTDSVKSFVDAISTHLLARNAEGQNTVVIIDEAQNLSADVLEQLRLLTNLETNERKLLRIILLGQPELETLLAQPELRQVEQRITARYHLQPLQRSEVGAYVQHRLAVAGRRDPVFAPRVLARLYRQTGGIPRLINIICDRAMLGAYVSSRHRVDQGILDKAAREVRGRRATPARLRAPFATAALLAGATATAALYYVHVYRPGATPAFITSGNAPASMPGPPPGWSPGPASGQARAPAQPATGEPPAPAFAQALAAVAPEPRPALSWPRLAVASPDASPAAHRALFERWQVRLQDSDLGDPCTRANAYGLRCHQATGNLGSLAGIDRPAILTLRDTQGTPFEATLVGLHDARATLAFADGTETVNVSDLEKHWQGGYKLLWRVSPQGYMVLRPGARGSDVSWLTARLARATGAPESELVRDMYDGEVTAAVRAFQRAQGLQADGVAGRQTLMRLNSLSGAPVPRLAARGDGR